MRRDLCRLLVVLCVVSCSEPEIVRVRGELVFDDKRQTLTACDGGRVYWVRVLASVPHHKMRERVDAITKQGGTVIAELEGETEAISSRGPSYPVDAVLRVRLTHGLNKGACGG